MSELVWAALGVCLAFSFFNGFTDAAYSISTIIATRVLTPLRAVAIAGVGNFLGLFFGKAVADTIGKGIIDTTNPAIAAVIPQIIIAALLGGLLFDVLTWWFALPVSESHILIGGLVGSGIAAAGLDVVKWGGVTNRVLIPMVVAPLVGFLTAFFIALGIMHAFRRRSPDKVNRGFARVQVGSSFFASLMHGSNDGQKFMGVFTLALLLGGSIDSFAVPLWVMLLCGFVMALGTALGGWRIIRTMGSKITRLEPAQGFAAETAASVAILTASRFGIPLSTTHTIGTAIMGVGATRRFSAVNWSVSRQIVNTWVLTFPACLILGYGFALVFKAF